MSNPNPYLFQISRLAWQDFASS